MGTRHLRSARHSLIEPDTELTELARRGDKSAYAELYRRHRAVALATARYLGGSSVDPDDLVAEAFAGVWSALRNGRGPQDNFRTYLLACVRNACRSRPSRATPMTAEMLERTDDDTGRARVVLEDPERYVEADTVGRAFASLTPRWQQALWMTEVEERTATEAGCELELSPNAAAALTLRARNAFATAYLSEHMAVAADPSCAPVAPLLARYVRGGLTPADVRAVDDHIAVCPSCADAVEHLRDVNASLRTLAPLPAEALGIASALPVTVSTGGGMASTGMSLALGGSSWLLKVVAVSLLVLVPMGAAVERQLAHRHNADADAETVGVAAMVTLRDPVVAAAPSSVTLATTSVTPPAPSSTSVPITLSASAPSTSAGVPAHPADPAGVGGLVQPISQPVEDVLALIVDPLVAPLESVVQRLTGPIVERLLAVVPLGTGAVTGLVMPLTSPVDATVAGATTPLFERLFPLAHAVGPGVVSPVTIVSQVDTPGAPGPDGSTAPSVGAPLVTVPPVTVPPVTVPPVTVPLVTVPLVTVPSVTVPPVTVPPVTVPPVTVPPVTVPNLGV